MVTSKLLSASPGMIAGPDLPPFMMSSRESKRSPAILELVWQAKQFWASTGRTCFSKNSVFSGVRLSVWAARNMGNTRSPSSIRCIPAILFKAAANRAARLRRLEFVAQGELHHARGRGVLIFAKRCRRVQRQAGLNEINVVERIEGFAAQLQAMTFPRHPKRLGDCDVHIS